MWLTFNHSIPTKSKHKKNHNQLISCGLYWWRRTALDFFPLNIRVSNGLVSAKSVSVKCPTPLM